MEEAIKHIENLLEVIGLSDLGCCQMREVDNVLAFLNKVNPKPDKSRFVVYDNPITWGMYIERTNPTNVIRAINKRHAKNLLGLNVKDVRCVIESRAWS